MAEIGMHTILRRTVTEEFFYDRDKVLAFVNDNPDIIDIKEWMDLDDIILELFDQLDGSIFGDELFGSTAEVKVNNKLLLRRDDE